jgi:hypothetical protein
MTNAEKLLILKVRLHKLESSPKAHDCPGVIVKVKRQIRNLER